MELGGRGMSRKQQVLTSLRSLESRLPQIEKYDGKKTLTAVTKELAKTRGVCRRSLSAGSYAAYGEIYDGLILAIRQMTESDGSALDSEDISLCKELLRYLIHETEKEKKFKKDIVFLPYKASM